MFLRFRGLGSTGFRGSGALFTSLGLWALAV